MPGWIVQSGKQWTGDWGGGAERMLSFPQGTQMTPELAFLEGLEKVAH
jgi:hypothetical protein